MNGTCTVKGVPEECWGGVYPTVWPAGFKRKSEVRRHFRHLCASNLATIQAGLSCLGKRQNYAETVTSPRVLVSAGRGLALWPVLRRLCSTQNVHIAHGSFFCRSALDAHHMLRATSKAKLRCVIWGYVEAQWEIWLTLAKSLNFCEITWCFAIKTGHFHNNLTRKARRRFFIGSLHNFPMIPEFWNFLRYQPRNISQPASACRLW